MSSRRVVSSYYLIAGLYTLAAALIWGVNTLFLLDAGLDLFGVFLANTAFALGSVAFEIPTGVLADTRGRRLSFLLSVAILMATTLVGDDCGAPAAPCAAQGLPDATLVDATPRRASDAAA